jgi:hypothetical protein
VWKSLSFNLIIKITTIFNSILHSECVPEDWTLVLLQPIHKKGDNSDPSNFRPIALATTILKLFTTIMSSRLKIWMDKHKTISDFQCGFRSKIGTVEQIFCLMTLIQSQLRKPKGKLFVCYVDCSSAYDFTNQSILWSTLSQAGISAKFINIFMSIYGSARGRVKTKSGLTKEFPFGVGVLQGEAASCYLFNLYINGIVKALYEGSAPPIKIGHTPFHILLFADDVAIVAKHPTQLQSKINIAAKFFKEMRMKVNINKTKVVVYQKRKMKNERRFNWYWDGIQLKEEDEYTYLGMLSRYNLSFRHTGKVFTTKGAAATANVLQIVRKSGSEVMSSHTKLFNAISRSTLMYAGVLWGHSEVKEMDQVQNSFYKKLLHLPRSTPGYFLRAECGYQHLSLQLFKDTLGFLERNYARDDSSPVKQCLIQQKIWYDTATTTMEKKYSWFHQIRPYFLCINELDFLKNISHSSIQEHRHKLVEKYSKFLQDDDWRRIQNSNFIPHYPAIKQSMEKEKFLNKNISPSKSSILIQLRLNKFSVKLGNHYIKFDTKCCLCTSNQMTSIPYFLFVCLALDAERKKYILPHLDAKNYNDSPEFKYVSLLNQSYTKDFINDMFLFWLSVGKLIDSCID